MKKKQIVKEKKLFDDIIHHGKYKKNNNFIIYNKESNYLYPRFGIAAGKKLGNAVLRNKLKRQVRMILTMNQNLFSKRQDYIIIVKKGSIMLSFEEKQRELLKLIEK